MSISPSLSTLDITFFLPFGGDSSNKILIIKNLYNWCSSWFYDVETEEELNISVKEFFIHVRSDEIFWKENQSIVEVKDDVQIEKDNDSIENTTSTGMNREETSGPHLVKYAKDYLSRNDVKTITEFVQTNLLHKKRLFAKCFYMHTRHFEERTTNPVEQQNAANKSGWTKTAPSMSLDTSAKKMVMKSRSTQLEKGTRYCLDVDKSNLWSKS